MADGTFEVIIKVKGFDYKLKKKRTGYFSLEYLYVPSTREYLILTQRSRSMSVETKLAAKIPYGGWSKDTGQIEQEKMYYQKKA